MLFAVIFKGGWLNLSFRDEFGNMLIFAIFTAFAWIAKSYMLKDKARTLVIVGALIIMTKILVEIILRDYVVSVRKVVSSSTSFFQDRYFQRSIVHIGSNSQALITIK